MDELHERRLERLTDALRRAGYTVVGNPTRGFTVIDTNNVIVAGDPQPLTLERLGDWGDWIGGTS